jgi:hypothetical protein
MHCNQEMLHASVQYLKYISAFSTLYYCARDLATNLFKKGTIRPCSSKFMQTQLYIEDSTEVVNDHPERMNLHKICKINKLTRCANCQIFDKRILFEVLR